MIFTIESKKDEFLRKVYEKSMKELSEFFEINWIHNKPKLFLIPDRKTITELRNGGNRNWVVGWINCDSVFVLDRKNYEKESPHKYSDEKYSCLIKHELTHCFSHIASNYKNKPDWLWEGLATYLSGQNKFKTKPKKLKDFIKFYKKKGKEVYYESGFPPGLV